MNSNLKYLSHTNPLSSFLVWFIKGIVRRLPLPIKHKILQNRMYRLVDNNSFKKIRSQTFYLIKKIHPIKFLETLNQRKIEYVLLRSWENLPNYPDKEDIDILISDEHRDLINDLVNHNKGGIKCDIYTVSGVKNGHRYGIPVFPYRLSHDLLKNRIFYKKAFVPSSLQYFASVAYHAVFHKAHNSGIPGFGIKPTTYTFDYTTALKEIKQDLGLTELEINVNELFKWLKKEGYSPAEDTLSKLVEINPELNILQSRLFSDLRGGDLLVYVVRERLVNEGLLEKFKNFLKDKYHFEILDVRMLSKEEREICTRGIRGGKWDEGPFRSSGGTPVAFIVAFDHNPRPLNSVETKKQPRMTNRNNLNAKYEFREIANSCLKDSFNGIHSSDNENDAWFYLAEVGEGYKEKIFLQTERIRKMRSQKKILSKGLENSSVTTPIMDGNS